MLVIISAPLHLFTGFFLTFFFSLFLIFSHFLRLPGRRGLSTARGTKNAGREVAATSQSHTHVMLHDTENVKKQRTHICILKVNPKRELFNSPFPALTSGFCAFMGGHRIELERRKKLKYASKLN